MEVKRGQRTDVNVSHLGNGSSTKSGWNDAFSKGEEEKKSITASKAKACNFMMKRYPLS